MRRVLHEGQTPQPLENVALLLKVLHQLRDAGNTIVIIEHNLGVIKTVGWLIDIGPEGGAVVSVLSCAVLFSSRLPSIQTGSRLCDALVGALVGIMALLGGL